MSPFLKLLQVPPSFELFAHLRPETPQAFARAKPRGVLGPLTMVLPFSVSSRRLKAALSKGRALLPEEISGWGVVYLRIEILTEATLSRDRLTHSVLKLL